MNQKMRFVLLVLFMSLSITVMSAPMKTPPLSPLNRFLKDPTAMNVSKQSIPGDFKTYFYDQTLDHFNYKPESYATFRQRYIINSKWWGGADRNSPIFVYFGAEGPIDANVMGTGFLLENAQRFNALLVYLEHRFYGESNPVGPTSDPNSVNVMEQSLKDADTRGYFNSAQALADYAELLLYIKETQLKAPKSPIIVIGGSYGGMLASWFRLKYPHIALGALASSAPILYFDGLTPQDGYYSIVTKDFQETSQNCYMTIKQSWDVIDRYASQPTGLAYLSQKFHTCTPLSSSSDLKDSLRFMYMNAAQYSVALTTMLCQAIDATSNDADILDRIFAALVAYQPEASCYSMSSSTEQVTQTSIGWDWQTCSEMVMPMGITSTTSMFQRRPFSVNEFDNDCLRRFGVVPRPHWTRTYYGGRDIRSSLSKFGSNIIFSNGLRDPYSSGGVLEDISDSIVALTTNEGSHCLDLQLTTETDPEWLVNQRQKEATIIDRWFSEYYKKHNILKQ